MVYVISITWIDKTQRMRLSPVPFIFYSPLDASKALRTLRKLYESRQGIMQDEDPLIALFYQKKRKYPLSQQMWWDRMIGWSRELEIHLLNSGHKFRHYDNNKTLIRWDLLVLT